MGFVIPVLSSRRRYGPGAPSVHRPQPGRHTVPQDRCRPGTYRGTRETRGASTQAHLGSCFVVYCTRSRAGQAGPCGTGRFPAQSRCRVPSPQAPGHTDTDTPGLSPTHMGRDRSDSQVILPSSLQREQECGQNRGSERRPAGLRQCPEPPGLLWSTSSEQKPHHLNTTAQGPRAAHRDTPGTHSDRL